METQSHTEHKLIIFRLDDVFAIKTNHQQTYDLYFTRIKNILDQHLKDVLAFLCSECRKVLDSSPKFENMKALTICCYETSSTERFTLSILSITEARKSKINFYPEKNSDNSTKDFLV